jgi:hypothetical protein
VEDAGDFDRFIHDPIDHYVGQRRERQLPPPRHAASGAPKVRKVLQPGAAVINGLNDAAGTDQRISIRLAETA